MVEPFYIILPIFLIGMISFFVYRFTLCKKWDGTIKENITIHVLNLASRFKKWTVITNFNCQNNFNPKITLKKNDFSYNLNWFFTRKNLWSLEWGITQNYSNICWLRKWTFTWLTIQFKDDSQDLYIIFSSKKQCDKVYDFLIQKAKI